MNHKRLLLTQLVYLRWFGRKTIRNGVVYCLQCNLKSHGRRYSKPDKKNFKRWRCWSLPPNSRGVRRNTNHCATCFIKPARGNILCLPAREYVRALYHL